jgi:hypothetical protein
MAAAAAWIVLASVCSPLIVATAPVLLGSAYRDAGSSLALLVIAVGPLALTSVLASSGQAAGDARFIGFHGAGFGCAGAVALGIGAILGGATGAATGSMLATLFKFASLYWRIRTLPLERI